MFLSSSSASRRTTNVFVHNQRVGNATMAMATAAATRIPINVVQSARRISIKFHAGVRPETQTFAKTLTVCTRAKLYANAVCFAWRARFSAARVDSAAGNQCSGFPPIGLGKL